MANGLPGQSTIPSPTGGFDAPTPVPKSAPKKKKKSGGTVTTLGPTPSGIPGVETIRTPTGGIDRPVQTLPTGPGSGDGSLLQMVPPTQNITLDERAGGGGDGAGGGGADAAASASAGAGIAGGDSGVNANLINTLYGNTLGFLNKQAGRVETRGDTLLDQLAGQVESQRGTLQRSFDQGKRNIGFQREQLADDRARNLQELNRNIRSAFQAGTLQIGNLGAGDSSATGQFGFALAREQNQNRADILRQAAQQNAQLDLALQNLNTEFQNQVANLGQFATQEKNRIRSQLQAQLDAIEEEKFNASQDRLAALNGLQTQLTAQAQQESNALDAQITNALDNLNLNKFNAENALLEELVNTQVQPIDARTTFSPLQGGGTGISGQQFPVPRPNDEEEV